MTIPEAVQASASTPRRCRRNVTPGDSGLFVLEMGQPVKIMDLARQMIALHGKEAERDIAIEIVGLKRGEKLTEELFDVDERPMACRTGYRRDPQSIQRHLPSPTAMSPNWRLWARSRDEGESVLRPRLERYLEIRSRWGSQSWIRRS